jgi:hypothetical protein
VIRDGKSGKTEGGPYITFTTEGYDGEAEVYYAAVAVPDGGTTTAPGYSGYTLAPGAVEVGDHKKGITLTGEGEYDIYVVLFRDGKVGEPVKINTAKDIDLGPGRFVAVISNSNRAVWSADGVNWEEATLPYTATWKDVAYGNGRFVAVAVFDTRGAAWSADGGATWTAATMPDGDWARIAYGNGRFVAISGDNKAAWSTDGGATWRAATMPKSNWQDVAYGNGGFVAVGTDTGNSTKIAWSADGATWTTRTASGAWTSKSQQWFRITYGNGRFVAVGWATDYPSNSPLAVWSADGVTWTMEAIPGYSYNGKVYGYTNVTYGNGRFIGIGGLLFPDTGVTLYYSGWSTDGVNWTTPTTPDGMGGGIVYGKGKFVTIVGTNTIAWSADGATWTKVTTTAVPSVAGIITYGEP